MIIQQLKITISSLNGIRCNHLYYHHWNKDMVWPCMMNSNKHCNQVIHTHFLTSHSLIAYANYFPQMPDIKYRYVKDFSWHLLLLDNWDQTCVYVHKKFFPTNACSFNFFHCWLVNPNKNTMNTTGAVHETNTTCLFKTSKNYLLFIEVIGVWNVKFGEQINSLNCIPNTV